jgi:hypothetical protein
MQLLEVYTQSFSYYYQALIVPLSILIPVCIAIFNYSYLTRPMRIILFYLIISGSINLLAILQSNSNNLPLLHIYTIVEFVLLAAYFISINKSKRILMSCYILIVVFPLLSIINVTFLQSKFQYNSYVRPLEALIFIFYSIIYFFNSVEEESSKQWGSNSLNWVNSGILLYFSSSLFLFVFSNIISLTLSKATKMIIWNFHDTVVIVLYVFIALGFSKCKKLSTIYTS